MGSTGHWVAVTGCTGSRSHGYGSRVARINGSLGFYGSPIARFTGNCSSIAGFRISGHRSSLMEDRVFLSGSAGRGSSLPGLAGYGSRARQNLHWNRRFSLLATVPRASGPLGSESPLTNHRILSSQSHSLVSSHCLSTLFPSQSP
jgi:hypothetical protein